MSLQERTLVVKNFDPERTTDRLLKELCMQGGPVRKVILRSDHAFVEFDDVESVGYTLALLDGVRMFGRTLSFEPKLRYKSYSKYTSALREYIAYDRHNRERQRQQIEQQQQMQLQMQMQAQMQAQFPQQLLYQPQHQPYASNLAHPPVCLPVHQQQPRPSYQRPQQYPVGYPPQYPPRQPDFPGP